MRLAKARFVTVSKKKLGACSEKIEGGYVWIHDTQIRREVLFFLFSKGICRAGFMRLE